MRKEVLVKRTKFLRPLLFFTILGSLFFISDIVNPLDGDDLLYQFKFENEKVESAPWNITYNKIENLWDIVTSQYYHWWYQNGRLGSHFIAQFFDGIAGKQIFSICNTIMYILLILLLYRFAVNNTHNHSRRHSLFVVIPCILFLQASPDTFYGTVVGPVGYMWSLVFNLIFLLLLFKERRTPLQCVVLWLITIFAAWSHEGLVMPMGAALALYCLLNWKKVSVQEKAIITIYLIITCVMVLAPANINRFLYTNEKPQPYIVCGIHLLTFKYIRISYLLLFAALYLWKRQRLVPFVKENRYILVAYTIALLFLLAVGPLNPRSVLFVDFFAILLLLRFINTDFNCILDVKWLRNTLAIGLIILFSSITYMQIHVGRVRQNVYDQLTQTTDKKCVVTWYHVPYSYPFIKLHLISMQLNDEANFGWNIDCWKYYFHKENISINFTDKALP